MDKLKEHIINQFIQQVGYVPNIDNPKSFNEKIQWLKLYYRDPLMTKCTDKYEVRDYIKNKIGEKYLIPLLGVYDTPEQIDFDKLPNKFVLKVNNASGRNIICKNKKTLDIEDAKKKLTEWLKPENSHYYYSYEWCYKNIKPKIICEHFLNSKNLIDYKFHCFNGKLKLILTCSERDKIIKKNFYDPGWNLLPVKRPSPNTDSNLPKPKNFIKMVEIAEILAKDFPFIRVDLYEINNKIYFGELTFYPENGMGKFEPIEWDYKIGKYLNINKIKNKNTSDYLNYKKTRKSKVAIYTANSENYDKLINHTHLSKDFDYVCFTDKKIINPGVWEIKPINKTKLDAVRSSRYYKLFPHELLSKYKYSVWVDTNIDVTSDILEKNVNELIKKKIKIAIPPHFERDCVYQEAKACIDFQKDDPKTILKQVDFLKKEQYPRNNGLFENNLIFREHNEPKIIKAMADWWWMINKFSRRDQLSLNYVLWKNEFDCTPLFPQNARLMNDDFVFRDHNKKIVSTVFISSQNEFNNNDFIQKIIYVSDNNYRATFKLSEYKIIKKILFNPLKNQFCQFKITKIKIDGITILLSKIKYETNGTLLDNGFIDFSKTSDPQILLSIDKKIKKLNISGIINFYNLENLYIDSTNQINNLVQEKDQIKIDSTNQINNLVQEKEIIQKENIKLKSGIDKIQSSKAYKIWQKYNSIKKKLKFKNNK